MGVEQWSIVLEDVLAFSLVEDKIKD